MIVHFDKNIDKELLQDFVKNYNAFYFEDLDKFVAITSSSFKKLSHFKYDNFIREVFEFSTDMQLSSKVYKSKREIVLNDGTRIGGELNTTLLMAGPCSVESEEQIEKSAIMLKELGLKILRAGSYKPRTSPYSFQGLGLEGLKLLDKMRMKYGLQIITEVRDSTHIDEIIEYADIVQIGAKSMYDHGILKKCSKVKKPILIKRGFGTTLQEFVQAAEFVLSGGNDQIILCERGIRTFETKTRFTLDLCGVAFLKEYTNLPIVLDPSHAMGYDYGVPDLSRACVAMGIDGLLIETHPDPCNAKSDASQQLNHESFKKMYYSLIKIGKAIDREII
ncbi:3-deoxy-7-phosphoheptulonate synthase [Campylobacter volucris]|uniref:3-deoxy-7-phosphoheptulonate synthase n=1 Tax=Campylobacter volucris TaxID=1031542 RepID=UPI00105A3D1B|nr:3-deoxy-7-phosphoheptulonate synthase [Campylobacter volucris]TDJ82100.1 3-deoxy-7-phosphoheptulonate synthase [Campylobacter volucris]